MAESRFGRDGGDAQRYGTYVGIVKNNIDPQNMGRCSVWIPEFGGDPDKASSWITVSYASPFAGSTPVENNRKDGTDAASTQSSYGFWMQPPDLDNHVLVTFANGNPAYGYWFACVYQQNMNHSVPGLPSNTSTDASLNDQGILPPTVEYNKKSSQNPDSPQRATFEPLHDGLSNQGLYKDAERGRSSAGARRESPSKTFGYSTPRGTAMLVDDNPENEHIRLRTRGGTQVLVHETSGYVYINSRSGNSWIEISDEGVDIYSSKSISVRAEEDLNFRADRDVHIEGERGVFIRAGQTFTTESGQNTAMKAGTDFIIGATGKFGGKAGKTLSLDASGDLTLKAGGNMLRTASKLHDNGPGAASVAAPQVRAQGNRADTQHDAPVGAIQSTAKAVTGDLGRTKSAVQSIQQTASKAVPAAQTLVSHAAASLATAKQAASVATGAVEKAAANVRVGEIGKLIEEGNATLKEVEKVKAQATQVVGQINEATVGVTSRVGELANMVSSRAQALTGVATAAITSAQQNIDSLKGKAKSALNSVSAIDRIGGKLGSELTSRASAINQPISQVMSNAQSIVGQTSAINGLIAPFAPQAAEQVSRLSGQALGAINTARTAVGTAMETANRVSGLVDRLGKAADNAGKKIASVADKAHALNAAPAAAISEAKSSAANLVKAAAPSGPLAAALKSSSTRGQSVTAKETTKKTIVSRLPSHEPFPSHVKEGQSSPAKQTSAAARDQQIANAAARPGQSIANGTPAKPVQGVKEVVQTGTGKKLKDLSRYVGPVLQIGQAAVRGDIVSAVKEAATISGIKPGYLMAKASEMGFNPVTALADARGLMQMTQGVYTALAERAGASHGVGVNDIYDPRANLIMGAVMTAENATYLESRGLATEATELNLAHLMGATQASQFLTNRRRDGSAPAYTFVTEDFARSHRTIFYGDNGVAKTADEVYAAFSSKIVGKANYLEGELKLMEVEIPAEPLPPESFI